MEGRTPPDARVHIDKLDLGAGYYVRDDDEIDAEYRLEAGYHYRWNRRLALRYTAYAHAARVISIGFGF